MKRATRGARQARVALLGLVLVMLGGLGMVALASAQGMPSPDTGQPVLDAPHGGRRPPESRLNKTPDDLLAPRALVQ